ncbi:MAG: hypothetical protein D6683_14295, partial [Actinomyces sp.]
MFVSDLCEAAGRLPRGPLVGWERARLADELAALGRVRAALDAYEAAVLGAIDALDDAGADAQFAVEHTEGCSRREARRRAQRAEQLAEMPRTRELLADADLNAEKVDLLTGAAARAGAEAVDADERLLAAVVRQPVGVAARTVRSWLDRRESAESSRRRLERQRRDRQARIWTDTISGMVRLAASFDPDTGARVRAALHTEVEALWRSDSAASSGDGPTTGGGAGTAGRDGAAAPDGAPDGAVPAAGARTDEQRVADALARLLGVEAPGPAHDPPLPTAKRVGTHVILCVDLPAPGVADGGAAGGGRAGGRERAGPRCEIIDTGPVPPAVLETLPPDSLVSVLLRDGPGRPLWLSRSRRLASLDQRLALAARDRACVACGAPFAHTRAHHEPAWTSGGRTDVDTLVS